ncbi:MAG: aminotransferase class I/II-fold pyridoxal phosphate-dependent enzyme [bacterium]|nr:aminotransferase class I/II-fold pyridoxal phosphate-dependent enzyme [bacterium]
MKIASRMSRLGTETAYAVSDAAKTYAKETGNKVYPFHLGDMNIRTAENIIEAAHKAMLAGRTGYTSAAGVLELKEALAEDMNRTRGTHYTAENISIQSGGKPVIGKFLMTLMEEGDEVLYPSPGYPIYESMIEFLEGVPKPYRYLETEKGYATDMDYFRSLIGKKTTSLIYNNYQNPMGVTSSDEEMAEIARLAVEHDLMVLADEAYFDIVYDGTGKSITSLPGMEERTVILYTFSKRFAMTGWRLGAAIGPKVVIDQINKINTNDEACTTHFIQLAGIEALKGPQEHQAMILRTLKERLDTILEVLADCPGIKVYRPNATFYLFINVTEALQKMGIKTAEEFRQHMLEKTGVSFTHRQHFGKPLAGETEQYIRFAYSGIDVPEIREGLGRFKEYIKTFFS